MPNITTDNRKRPHIEIHEYSRLKLQIFFFVSAKYIYSGIRTVTINVKTTSFRFNRVYIQVYEHSRLKSELRIFFSFQPSIYI